MKRFSLQETFLIKEFSAVDRYEDSAPRNYFEIIFIMEGTGRHCINEFVISYKKRDVFLIAPQDAYHFEIDTETTFCYFQFTKLLFSGKMNLPDRSYWLHRIEHIIHNPNLLPGDFIKEEYDRKLLWHIHQAIVLEYQGGKEFYKHNISNMVSTTLSIIARNIGKGLDFKKTKKKDKHATIDQILAHIRHHTYDNDFMKINYIANKFHMTPSALSAYFKRETGDSLHHYILMYKLHLVKYRLDNTDFTVSEIAHQLGFTDESHLTRIFKKYNEQTPKQYKQKKGEKQSSVF